MCSFDVTGYFSRHCEADGVTEWLEELHKSTVIKSNLPIRW